MVNLNDSNANDDDDNDDNDDDDANGEYRGDELLRLLLERRCHGVSLNLIRDLVRELSIILNEDI